MLSCSTPSGSSLARIGARTKGMLNDSSVIGGTMFCSKLTLKNSRSISRKANSRATTWPETSKMASGASTGLPKRSCSSMLEISSWIRILPSRFGSKRSKLTVAKTPPATPPLATPRLSSAVAKSPALNTTSGTSGPLPVGCGVSLTKKPLKISPGSRKPVSANCWMPRVSKPKAKSTVAPTVPPIEAPSGPKIGKNCL